MQDVVVHHREEPEEIPAFLAPKKRPSQRQAKKEGGSRQFAWIVTFVCLALGAGLFFYLSNIFSRAIVSVVPRTEAFTLDGTFHAHRGGGVGSVQFETVTLSAKDATELPATETRVVKTKASGKVVLYNAYSNKPQKLIANTRLSTSKGIVFRLPAAVTIPGSTKDTSGKLVPGSIEATVVSDKTGPSSNVGLADFTLPGFIGSPKYAKIYARSKTVMTGGKEGTEAVVSPDAITAAKNQLKQKLANQLTVEVLEEIPPGFVGYPSGIVVTFTDNSSGAVADAATTTAFHVEGEATLHGVVFKTADLAHAIAAETLTSYDDFPVAVPNIPLLEFTLDNKDNLDFETVNDVQFRLKGSGTVVWQFDQEALKKRLLGVSRSNYTTAFQGFPGVGGATATLNPFWASRFPTNPGHIIVETQVQ